VTGDSEATAVRILVATRSIAMVGASNRDWRDSHRVMKYLLDRRFDVYPVNPNADSILGRPCVAALEQLAPPIDTVVCFRRSSEIEGIARSAIAIGARHLWMQLGVINAKAAELARSAGLLVVMVRCIMVDHRRHALRT